MRPTTVLFIYVASAAAFTFSLGFGAGVLWGPSGPTPRAGVPVHAPTPTTAPARCEAERDQLRELYLSCSRGWGAPATDPPPTRPHTHQDAGPEAARPPARPPEEEGCSH